MSRFCFPAQRLATVLVLLAGCALSQNSQLPAGPGKEVMERVCGNCHAADLVSGKGNTRDGWTQIVGVMISRGAQGTDDEFATIVDYLTANFPPSGEIKKVNVNKAPATEIQSTLQLAERDALAMVEYRKQKGDFKTIDDIKKVPGIDTAKVDTNKQKITF